MATYIKILGNETLFHATIGGKMSDKEWNGRASKYIHAEITYEQATALFTDDVKWSIIQDVEHEIDSINEETGEMETKIVIEQEVYDNSEYSVLGDITIHKDGTVTICMGKPTAEEILAMLEEVF